ncbi:MAG: hypothetical protein CBC42_01255 [Betaproteobacteria bacterium TMED82]|nr:MAG: hypothetical protein CBC42_01255 [Betaproteobacteria bacterium TMED82]|tara:strand:+ start:1705 stop:1938 length:234 start_codon:yes stop_codon:yes gene_type:complete
MTFSFVNIGLTIAGLSLIILFYLPLLREFLKSPKQFFLYFVFWLVLLFIVYFFISGIFFPELSLEDLFETSDTLLET